MVCFATKIYAPIIKKRRIIYRSYKHCSEQTYIQDLSYIPFQVCEIFDHVDDTYWFSQSLIRQVIDNHAPLKRSLASDYLATEGDWANNYGVLEQK